MNERIEKLAAQAGASRRAGVGGLVFRDSELEKFARLIVRECAQVCLSQRDPANLNYKPSERFAEAVKQHFGVE